MQQQKDEMWQIRDEEIVKLGARKCKSYKMLNRSRWLEQLRYGTQKQ